MELLVVAGVMGVVVAGSVCGALWAPVAAGIATGVSLLGLLLPPLLARRRSQVGEDATSPRSSCTRIRPDHSSTSQTTTR